MNNTALVAPFCQPASSADWGASRLATGAARCRLECETGGGRAIGVAAAFGAAVETANLRGVYGAARTYSCAQRLPIGKKSRESRAPPQQQQQQQQQHWKNARQTVGRSRIKRAPSQQHHQLAHCFARPAQWTGQFSYFIITSHQRGASVSVAARRR